MENDNNLQHKLSSTRVVPSELFRDTQHDFILAHAGVNRRFYNHSQFLFYLSIVVVLFIIGSFGYYFFIQNHHLKHLYFVDHHLQRYFASPLPQPVSAFQAEMLSETNTHTIAFVREGDIWVSSIDGSDQQKITSHVPVSYRYRHYLTGEWLDREWGDEFYTQPRLSSDGRYLAYLGIKEEAIEKMKQWKEHVKNEPKNIANSDSKAFEPPRREYEVKIFDLYTRNEIYIADTLDDPSVYIDYYELFDWARDKNILAFNWNSSTYFFDQTGEGQFNVVSLKKDIFSYDPLNLQQHNRTLDFPVGGILSPDGNYLLGYYYSRHCLNRFGGMSYLVDLVHKKLIKLPMDTFVTCASDNLGWIDNTKFYLLELGQHDAFTFSFWSGLFRQEVFRNTGLVYHATVSPDGQWLTYLIKDRGTGLSEYVFLNLQTQEATNLLGVMQEGGTRPLVYGTIFTPQWSRDSQFVILKMTRKSDNISDLIKYYPKTKEYKVILENVSDFDIH